MLLLRPLLMLLLRLVIRVTSRGKFEADFPFKTHLLKIQDSLRAHG
jgi:hypothetical protein